MVQDSFSQDERQWIIRTSGLTKTFGTLVAVNNLQLEVLRGDVFGFLGPNGSGKTTTIRMLLGLIRPTAGEIDIFTMDQVTHLSEILPRIGALVETPVFYPYLSGVDNLRLVAAASGMRLGKASQPRIDEILELVDLQRQAGDAYRKYSLGMKQRLGIGAALLTDPELVMLDEPTNGLDPAGVHEVRELILRLSALGKTVFLSSHILHEIQQVCTRVAILQKGKLLRQGTVSELLRQGEQVMVRLSTPEETQRALAMLQRACENGVAGITRLALEKKNGDEPVIRVDMPTMCSAELTALLARNELFVAELAPYQTSLEEVFLEVTTEERARPGMAALADVSRTFAAPELSGSRKRER